MTETRASNPVVLQRACFESMYTKLEQAVNLHRARGGAMNELAVTYSIVTQLGLLRHFAFVTPEGSFVSVRMLPYEQTKPVEQLFGDVAIIVDLKFDDNHAAQGVVYFENKLVRKGVVRYRPNQPEKYLRNSGHIYAMYIMTEAPISVGSAGLAIGAHETSIGTVPAGLVLEN